MYWNVCKSCSRSNAKDYLNIREEKAVCVLHHCTGHMMDYCKTLHGTTNATNARSHHVCALALTTVYASVCKCMHFFCSCFIFLQRVYWCCTTVRSSPPPVDPNVGRSSEPRVEDVNAADAVRSLQRVLEGRVVVEPQALPEPVDCINDHHSTGRVLFKRFKSLSDILDG